MTKVDCKSQLKFVFWQQKHMTCNDLLNLQKSALLTLRRQDPQHYLNPFGELLFSQSWRWSSQQHQYFPKGKSGQGCVSSSLKKDILVWQFNFIVLVDIVYHDDLYFILCLFRFENLTNTQKIAVTAISSPQFTDAFIKMLPHRKQHRIFNLPSQRWVDGIYFGQEDAFFDELLKELRVGYVSESVLYFQSAEIMGLRMLSWLNKVSNSKVFQYASKGKKDEQNALWFSSVSYRYLQDWLANEIQMSIVRNYFNKSIPQFIVPELQSHLKTISKSSEANGLSLAVLEVHKKSKCEINSIKSKLKQQEQKFIEFRQLKLLKSMQSPEEPNKKKNKRKGKKKIIAHQKDSAEPLDTCKDNACQQTNNTNSPSLTPTLLVPSVNSLIPSANSLSQAEQRLLKINQQSPIVAQNQDIMTKNGQKTIDIEGKPVKPKNLIRVSPKRKLSPEHAKRENIFDSMEVKQKYSQERYSITVADDQKSSDPPFSIEQPNTFQQPVEKKRRKRGRKENQKLNQVKEILYNRLICRQIDNLVDQLGLQTNSLYNHKIISFERVRTYIQSLYPAVNAVLFGSNAIGLSLPNSDVDILLTGLNCSCKEQASEILAQIAVQINAMGWVVSCSTYLWAKVPIVKLQIDTSIPFLQTKRRQDLFRVYNPALLYHLDNVGEVSVGTIKVDITINIQGVTSVGYESTVLMREWIFKMPILQKLVLLLKYLLFYQGYNSNFTGGIGSYCLFVMVAAFMKDNAREKEGYESKQFLNILKWYGQEFDNHNYVVWLKEEGNCFINKHLLTDQRDEKTRDCQLKLIDPITGKYMNSSCNQYNNIKMEFRRIYEELGVWKNMTEDELRLGSVTTPQLMKIIQTKKSIDKWLNKLEQKHELSLRRVIQRTFN